MAHDEQNPFGISAGNSRIRVLGTKFNVNAYPAEDYLEVALAEGKVEIMDKDLENDVIRGTFQDDSLSEVLRLLSMTSPIRYKIMERKTLPDGSFEKGKVLLNRKNIAIK